MELSEVLAQLSEEIPEQLKQVATQAKEVRGHIKEGHITDGPGELHEQLLLARRAQDRLEGMLATLGRLHYRAVVVVDDLRGRLDDAEANANYSTDEYASGKERNAALMLATVEERLALRRAQRQKAEIDEVYEYVRTLHRGVDGVRRDLDLRIRLFSMTTMLEK